MGVIGWPRLVRRHSASALTFGASHAVQGTAEGENSKSSVVDLEKRDTQAQSSHSSFRSNSLRRWLAAYARQPGRTRFFFSLSNLGASFSAYGHEQTRDFSGKKKKKKKKKREKKKKKKKKKKKS